MRGVFTCVGWQVILCYAIWLVTKDRPKPVNAFSAENENENESHYFQLFFKSKSCIHYYTINIDLPNIESYQCRPCSAMFRCIFSPCTVCLSGLSLPSDSSFEHSKHFALLMSVSHLVKYSQITLRDDRDIVIIGTTVYCLYVSNLYE